MLGKVGGLATGRKRSHGVGRNDRTRGRDRTGKNRIGNRDRSRRRDRIGRRDRIRRDDRGSRGAGDHDVGAGSAVEHVLLGGVGDWTS